LAKFDYQLALDDSADQEISMLPDIRPSSFGSTNTLKKEMVDPFELDSLMLSQLSTNI